MYPKSAEEIALIQQSAEILSKLLAEVIRHIEPGVTTKYLDELAENYLKKEGAQASFKGFEGYPNVLCTSVNDQIIHGIPSSYVLKEGDIVSVDCGVCHQGYHADAAFTHIVGDMQQVSKELVGLLLQTEKALELGIAQAHVGKRVGDIGYAIEKHVRQHGYSVVKNYGGHGLGAKLHEPPHISNFGRRGSGIRIQEGMVLAIEPLVNLGSYEVVQKANGWTIGTKDQKPSAHFEHTIAIVDGKPKVLTSFEYIKKVIYD